jgi:hypothetical protein
MTAKVFYVMVGSGAGAGCGAGAGGGAGAGSAGFSSWLYVIFIFTSNLFYCNAWNDPSSIERTHRARPALIRLIRGWPMPKAERVKRTNAKTNRIVETMLENLLTA